MGREDAGEVEERENVLGSRWEERAYCVPEVDGERE